MNANEIKALKEKIKNDEKELRTQKKILKDLEMQVRKKEVYQNLLTRQKNFARYIATNKMPKNVKGLPKSLCWQYSFLFNKELLLFKLKFENTLNDDSTVQWVVCLLKLVYSVDDIRLCIREEDILPLDPFMSEEDFIKNSDKNYYPLFSRIFTNEKLMEIVGKIEDKKEESALVLHTHLVVTFSLEERIKFFSPEINFVTDSVNYLQHERQSMSYQTSLNINPSLYPDGWFKPYIKFLEGKIDPDVYIELYLTHCQ